MGECALAIAIAERPDARHVRAQLIVDLDEAFLIGCDRSLLKPEIVGVGAPPDRQQKVGADDLGCSVRALETDGYVFAALGNAEASSIEAQLDPFALQNVGDRLRDILVFA